jgi:hypothetical protein
MTNTYNHKFINYEKKIYQTTLNRNISSYLNLDKCLTDADIMELHSLNPSYPSCTLFIKAYKLLDELIEFNIIDYDDYIKQQVEYLNNLESKFDKKFKELTQALDIKNENIRSLELKVHFLESQIDKKVQC